MAEIMATISFKDSEEMVAHFGRKLAQMVRESCADETDERTRAKLLEVADRFESESAATAREFACGA